MTGKRPTHTRKRAATSQAVHRRYAREQARRSTTRIGSGNGTAIGSHNEAGSDAPLITRRRFLLGAVGIGAAAAAAGGGIAIASRTNGNDKSELTALDVPEDAVSSLDGLTEIDSSSAMTLVGNFELPYGTLAWSSDGAVAACLLPTEQSKPLAQIGILSLSTGECPVVVSQAIGQNEGFEIFDVRACSTGLVWVEADILEGLWRVYSAPLNGGNIGTPVLLEEGSSDWEMPALAVAGDFAFWQTLPKASGKARSENSLVKRAAFGSTSAAADIVCTSHGRMSTPPYALADSIVVTPRTNTSSVHHQLTCIDAQTGSVTDAMVLPTSMKPLEAGYGNNGFMFSFDSIYNYGGGIANLGTYTPKAAVQPAAADGTGNAAYSDAEWFRFPRNPTAPPAWCGKWLMVKSTSAVCGVDLEAGTYFSFDVKSGTDSYGDYLASTGVVDVVVTYSNIDYQPLDGDAQKYCNVRVWAPA